MMLRSLCPINKERTRTSLQSWLSWQAGRGLGAGGAGEAWAFGNGRPRSQYLAVWQDNFLAL